MRNEISIAGRPIGLGHRPYVVAELSANHLGGIERAFAIMETAKRAGADAVKLQTYTPDTMTIDHDGPDFILKGGLWDRRQLYDLYREAHTPWEWHPELFAHGRRLGIPVFSTPFDESAVEYLERFDVPAYKIASFELIDLSLIRRVAATGRPVIISTGMGSPQEIAEAVAAFRGGGGRDLLLLHCVSGYPTPVEQSNLRRIPNLAREFDCPVGLSDHTLGIEVAVASVVLGACAIEKHFTLRRDDGGPDAAFSLEPEEFSALARGARAAFDALGNGTPDRAEVEVQNLPFRRSIYVVRDIAKGEAFTSENLRIIRPGYGLPPKHLAEIIGKRLDIRFRAATG